MKQLLIAAVVAASIASTAQAFDLDGLVRPSPVSHDWSGFYAGVVGSAGWMESVLTPTLDPSAALTTGGRGFLGGIQVGADFQYGTLVIGGVADIALSDVETKIWLNADGGTGFVSRLDYLGTLRARIGISPVAKSLAYLHGGVAYGRSTPTETQRGAVTQGFTAANRVGWTVGAGVEYAMTDNISAQAEYGFVDLGNPLVTNFPGAGQANERLTLHTVKAGLNYRF